MKPRAKSIDTFCLVFGTCLAKTDVHASIGPRGVGGVCDARESEGTQHELVEVGGALQVAHGEIDVIETQGFHTLPFGRPHPPHWHTEWGPHQRAFA